MQQRQTAVVAYLKCKQELFALHKLILPITLYCDTVNNCMMSKLIDSASLSACIYLRTDTQCEKYHYLFLRYLNFNICNEKQ